MVARARAPSSSDTEAIGLDVSIRLACGLIAEAFIAVRDAFKTFPELRGDSKSGAYLVSLLLDHGVEKLCLDKVLELPFYGEMEKLLLDLLWARRSEVPVETGILYLLNRGRALEASEFFATHEVVGSSLLFVYDEDDGGPPPSCWMIDFAKTQQVDAAAVPPSGLTHRAKWELGNHEDGYLSGLDSLIDVWGALKLQLEMEASAAKADD